jgi:hypothetical protein
MKQYGFRIFIVTAFIFNLGLLLLSSSLAEQLYNIADGEINATCKPPRNLKLTSILYKLAIASEPYKFAKQHGIILSNGRVRVFIFLNPDSSSSERERIVENYKIAVEKKSNDLLRALLPVNILIPISQEPIIGSISLPDLPIKNRASGYEHK